MQSKKTAPQPPNIERLSTIDILFFGYGLFLVAKIMAKKTSKVQDHIPTDEMVQMFGL